MRWDVHVTDEDIDQGVAGSEGSCPIALAIKRSLGCEEVSVFDSHNAMNPDHRVPGWITCEAIPDLGCHTFETNTKADNFIKTFDRGDNVEPFSFVLEA